MSVYKRGAALDGWRCVTCREEFPHDTLASPGKRWVYAALVIHTITQHRRLPVSVDGKIHDKIHEGYVREEQS